LAIRLCVAQKYQRFGHAVASAGVGWSYNSLTPWSDPQDDPANRDLLKIGHDAPSRLSLRAA
jgi:hypothetical protein